MTMKFALSKKSGLRFLAAILLSGLLAACGSMPKHNETTIDKASSIVFTGGPIGSAIFVDGAQVAIVKPKTSETKVIVMDGSRNVVVRSGSAVLYEKIVIVNDGARKIIDLGKRK